MKQQSARVFISGNSQAVRLPAQFRFDTPEVYIRREGNQLILSPKPSSWDGFMDGCEPLSDDFSVTGPPLPDDIERRSL